MPGTNFPTSLDDDTSLIVVTDITTDVLAVHHNYLKDAVKAIETKFGVGADTPTSGEFLVGNTAAGSSHWRVLADADIPNLTGKTYNGLTLTAAATGFTIAGGTTSKTLTVPLDASVAGTYTGDQDLSGYLLKSTYDANSILIATSDNTPIALTVGASTIVGRKATGDIVALTATETRTILNVADGATANAKATAAELNAGTDDAKFATALAIAGRAEKDGWTPARGTWTYASATTITVASGAAAIYQIGDKLRWKQGGGYLYGTIIAVADTLLTLATNNNYAVVTPAAITDNYYSHIQNPMGFPDWFAYTPVWTGFSADPTGIVASFSIFQGKCTVVLGAAAGGTSSTIGLTVTLPVTPTTSTYVIVPVINNSLDEAVGVLAITAATTTADVYRSAFAAWTDSNVKRFNKVVFTYDI